MIHICYLEWLQKLTYIMLHLRVLRFLIHLVVFFHISYSLGCDSLESSRILDCKNILVWSILYESKIPLHPFL